MDKFFNWLTPKVKGFFDWWKNLTGLPTVNYGSFSVNWSIVALVVLVWVAMFLFLPGGLLFD